ncbi:MAG TPA: sigma-70 family RNA polymerase sigma factor [Kofleriaceae bacterium]|nr:sigma-70 family RNA polymerase sigma factor [Kofleriaceae bacterium]
MAKVSAVDELHREDADIEDVLTSGDRRRALTMLMERYGDHVYRFARAMTHEAAMAEDVRQQVFVEAYRDFTRFERRSSLRTWLFGIARHRCLDAAKIHRRWWRRFKNDPPDETELEPPEYERQADRTRIARLLWACLDQLAPAAREAVALRYIEELAYEEIAAITGDLAGTLQQRVGRALPVLRRCVDTKLRARPSAVGGSR